MELLGLERTYSIGGRDVAARIIESKQVRSGATEVLVQTSCIGPDEKTHHQTNSVTLIDPTGGEELETCMYRFAEWLLRLIWDKPRVTRFMGELQKADGKYIYVTCSFNIAQTLTAISPEWIEIAGLTQAATFTPQENPAISFPVYSATLRFGKRVYTTNVIAANMNDMCVIGTNLILEAIGERNELIFDLLLPDVVRVLRNAARSKEATVLILGSYTVEGRSRLEKIRSSLQKYQLDGVIVSDFADIHQQSLYEKMLMFGSLARFVICDESVASGHLIELKACADIGFVTAILRNHGKPVTWMNADIAFDRPYMKIIRYDSDEEIEPRVEDAVVWAQNKIQERAEYYNREYPWRNPNVRLG